ncbi:MAG: VTT domain-containing protein [Candidatus Aenigmatarchaeota archaeon]
MDLGTLTQQLFDWSNEVAQTWGYFGIFIISFIGNASIFLPVPAYIITVTFGSILNPWLVGIASALGAALGEITGYLLGRGGREVLLEKYEKNFKRAKKWIETHGIFPVIILFAATPLPDEVVGIMAGAINYNIKKFLLASFLGKLLLYTALAMAGYYGISFVLGLFAI